MNSLIVLEGGQFLATVPHRLCDVCRQHKPDAGINHGNSSFNLEEVTFLNVAPEHTFSVNRDGESVLVRVFNPEQFRNEENQLLVIGGIQEHDNVDTFEVNQVIWVHGSRVTFPENVPAPGQ